MDGLESWVSLFFCVSLLFENVRKLESMDYLFSFATGDYPYLPRLFIYLPYSSWVKEIWKVVGYP